MNAETAREHMSREPDQQPDLTDVPLSGRSQPRPVPFTGRCDLRFWHNDAGLYAECVPHDQRIWVDGGHDVADFIRLLADHAGTAAAVLLLTEALTELGGGRIPAQKNEGEPDSGAGPGPRTADFSSPSSPPAAHVGLAKPCGAGLLDLSCTLPAGHYDHHHSVWHGHSITWPADQAPFGSESEPQS